MWPNRLPLYRPNLYDMYDLYPTFFLINAIVQYRDLSIKWGDREEVQILTNRMERRYRHLRVERIESERKIRWSGRITKQIESNAKYNPQWHQILVLVKNNARSVKQLHQIRQDKIRQDKIRQDKIRQDKIK